MGAIIAAITSLGGTAAVFAIKIFGSLGTIVGGWMANFGWKLLSFEWISKIYNVLGKIFGVLKKTVFNAKVVSIIKVLLSFALFALVCAQIYFIAKVYLDHGSFENDDKPVLILNLLSVVFCLIFCFAFIIGLFKKKLRYGFIVAIVVNYFITVFSCNLFGGILKARIYEQLLTSFDTLKIPFLLAFALLSVFKLINVKNPTSVFAFILSAGCAVLAFLSFQGAMFANFAEYTYYGGEVVKSSADIGALGIFQELSAFFGGNGGGSGLGAEIVKESLALAETKGAFIAGLAVTCNVGLIIIGKLLPYVMASVAVGSMMSMLNDRPKQCVYIARCIRVLKYAFWGVFTAVLCGIGALIFSNSEALTVSLNAGGYIVTLIAIIGILLLLLIARKLITDKFVNKFKKYLG